MELSYKQTLSRTLLCYTFLLGFTLLLQALLASLCMTLWPQITKTDWYLWVLSYVPLYLVAVPLFFVLLRRLVPGSTRPAPHALTLAKQLQSIVLSLGLAYLFNVVSMGFLLLFSKLTGLEVVNPLTAIQAASSGWLNLLFGCIVAPVGEEFLFRKALYDKIGRFGQKPYVLLGGLIFGLFHGNLSQFLYAFALGVVFCYLYAKTGNLLYTIALHIIVNLFGLMLAPLAAQSTAGSTVLGAVVLACICGACVIAWRGRSRITLEPGESSLPAHPARASFGNAGMVVYLVLCAVVIAFALLQSALAPLLQTGGAA